MRKTDGPWRWLLDCGVALVLLTRLPLPALPQQAFARQAQAVWAFPLAGLATGLPAVAAGAAALAIGLPAPVAAGLVLALQVILSGGMHEDGLADSADGLWGGLTRERRLEIMKDSRIGSYGVLALVLGLGLRWSALSALIGAGAWGAILATALLSRAMMPALMAALPPARAGGLSRSVGRPRPAPALVALLLALALGLGLVGGPVWAALLAAGIVAWGCAALARAKIGGQTGDILGATQQLTEIAALLAFCTRIGPA
ncbi:adenosylcobinamide-GDP ribazoletransferase [Pseudodonghicola flavimaris]|uniref:Adenosylcobinamide-GDP ribazoletransferase n=1 Tax=Pseudodonghicola flavimaris TaxID=3050036 RepID=A0ABT7F540_9RHOB|nr:adenosylcobinamide-GDP ribazoletransferase [Pseudodonghicola flavimaris]MDK3019725.1 adenosylcobinamide-GDP ribazoletransferase [Pseudodonghicola flavimaris]